MPAGTYAVVRYIADPARDEPINVGIVARGPAGAVFKTDATALDRMRLTDPYVDPATFGHITEYLNDLVSRPLLRFALTGPETVAPWQPGFLDALRARLPERFTAGDALFIEYADESRAAMENAAADLVERLVKPATRKPRFPSDPGAPLERLKKLLAGHIQRGQVMVQPAVQGFTHRVRRPDLYYRRADGTPVVIATVKLSQRAPHIVSQTADAKAFELFDIKTQQKAHTVAVVEPPDQPTPAYLDSIKSIEAIADQVLNAREDVPKVVEQVERDLALV